MNFDTPPTQADDEIRHAIETKTVRLDSGLADLFSRLRLVILGIAALSDDSATVTDKAGSVLEAAVAQSVAYLGESRTIDSIGLWLEESQRDTIESFQDWDDPNELRILRRQLDCSSLTLRLIVAAAKANVKIICLKPAEVDFEYFDPAQSNRKAEFMVEQLSRIPRQEKILIISSQLDTVSMPLPFGSFTLTPLAARLNKKFPNEFATIRFMHEHAMGDQLPLAPLMKLKQLGILRQGEAYLAPNEYPISSGHSQAAILADYILFSLPALA